MKFLLVFILFFSFLRGQSQEEASIWYFGEQAGIDFNSGVPVVLFDGQLDTDEGCSTISNANGQLLFYTDGITVWDKNHDIMPNGTGLLGDPSSTQSGIIVPKPDNPDVYYIFTVDKEAGADGLRYSEVDITLNGGNGAITSNKNVFLFGPTTEKISAVRHGNGIDFWVITHAWNSADFMVYKIDSNGVNATPVITTVGSVHGGSYTKTIGYLKASPDGTRIALAVYSGDSYVELFDFDSATGVVSNPILIDGIFYEGQGNRGAYGVEFSPDSSILYVSDTNFVDDESKVHQFDLSFSSATDIINSDQILYAGTDIISAIQLAIDQRIYLSNSDSHYLDIIESPNSLGVGAGYVNKAFDLSPRMAVYGLPPFIQSFFIVGINAENTCFGGSTQFTVNSNEDIVSIFWDFGDGTTSTMENPSHTYASTGDYLVTVTVSTASEVKTLSKDIIISDTPIANGTSDYIVCDDVSNDGVELFDLTTKSPQVLGTQSTDGFGVDYFATQEDAETGINILPTNYSNTESPQEIFARVYNKANYECHDLTSFHIIVHKQPIANPINDLVLCDNEINDESEQVTLSMFDEALLNGQEASFFNISYHLSQNDADLGINPLPDEFQTVDNPQSLFVRIENMDNPMCYDTTSFNIIIDGQLIAYQPQNVYSCDDSSNDEIELFDFSLQNDQVINGQNGSYAITYHLTEEDASFNLNPLPVNYQNISNPQQIFVRMERSNNSNCFDVTSFNIGVLPYFDTALEDEVYLCSNEVIILSAIEGYDDYLWSTGETTSSIVVQHAGTYSLTITRNYGTNPPTSCTVTKTVQVIESDEATLLDVEIEDWSAQDNSIMIFVDGIGDYEYSLDGIQYQDSSIFEHLPVGEYVVYIRDKNGCGEIMEEVYLLYYPKFFTPNGDGYNEYWQIYFAYAEPDLIIYIFDRNGKLLTQLKPSSLGWDGTYNGKLMPTNDYWFLVVRPSNSKEYRGHFTLKR